MAATVSSSAWAKPGAWALDSEEHEEELKQDFPTPAAAPAAEFPSLSAAVTAKPKKKSKGQTLSLAEFSTYKAPSNQEEVPLNLPTAPRERTQEELDQARSRGFRNFDNNTRESRARPQREDGDMGPSRADEADDWSRTKKSPSSFDRDNNRERDMGPSRADEVDDWSKGKRFTSTVGGPGGGERRDKVGFFNSSRADEVDNWAARKSYAPSSGGDNNRRERRVGFDATGPASDLDNWSKNKVVVESNGNGNGGGRPRLNLQPRTLPVEKIVVKSDEIVEKEDVVVEQKEEVFVPTERKPKENPFGAARPREEVLKEKGQDWKELDEKLEAVKIKEAEIPATVNGGGGGGEGFTGRRRGFGLGSGEERSVRTWRKPDSPNGRPAVASPNGRPDVASPNGRPADVATTTPVAPPTLKFGSFVDTPLESAGMTETAASTEKVSEEN